MAVVAGRVGVAVGEFSGLRVGVDDGVGRGVGAAGGVSHVLPAHEGDGLGVVDGVELGVELGVVEFDGDGLDDVGGFGGRHLPSLSRPLPSTHGVGLLSSRGGVLFGDPGLRGLPLSHWNPHSRRNQGLIQNFGCFSTPKEARAWHSPALSVVLA